MASLYLKAKTDTIASLSPLRCDYFKYKQRMILIIRKGHSSLYWLSLWNGSSPWESENVFEKKKKLQGWWDWLWLQLVVFKLLHNNIILADQMAGILFFKALKSKKGFLHSHSQAPNVNITVCFVDWVGLYRCPSHPYQRHQPVRVQDQSSG